MSLGQLPTVSAGTNVWTGHGPESGIIYALAIDPATPTTLYAGTWSGVFKSTDGGENWSAANTGLTNSNVRALAIDPQNPATLYAGTYGGGVFDYGAGGLSLPAADPAQTVKSGPNGARRVTCYDANVQGKGGGLTHAGADAYPCASIHRALPAKASVIEARLASHSGWARLSTAVSAPSKQVPIGEGPTTYPYRVLPR